MIRKKQKNQPIVIDLTGPQGNAYQMLQYARELCKAVGRDYRPVQKQMMEGDYENLIEVFDSYFGDFVILER